MRLLSRAGFAAWSALLVVSLTTSCTSSQRLIARGETDKLSDRAFLAWAISQDPNWQNVDIRGKGEFEQGNTQQSFTYRLKLIRDSVIWVSISKFGFEGVRALITTDSVFVLNRLDRTYSSGNLAALGERYQVPASFSYLEGLLLGLGELAQKSTPYAAPPAIPNAEDTRGYKLGLAPFEVLVGFSTQVGRPAYVHAQHPDGLPASWITYRDYQVTDGQALPYLAEVQVTGAAGTSAVRLSMAHNRVAWNATSPTLSFSRPDGYSETPL